MRWMWMLVLAGCNTLDDRKVIWVPGTPGVAERASSGRVFANTDTGNPLERLEPGRRHRVAKPVRVERRSQPVPAPAAAHPENAGPCRGSWRPGCGPAAAGDRRCPWRGCSGSG